MIVTTANTMSRAAALLWIQTGIQRFSSIIDGIVALLGIVGIAGLLHGM